MMKSLWNSFKIAFAMFSKIPMPQADWSEENMRYMLCFFPFVGAAVGVVMLGMEWLCRYFGMSNGFIAVALVLVPVIVTGGIHVCRYIPENDSGLSPAGWQTRRSGRIPTSLSRPVLLSVYFPGHQRPVHPSCRIP